MKRLPIIALICLLGASGCQKVKHLADISVDIPYSTQVAVPQVSADTAGAPLPGGGVTLDLPPVSVATNSQQYLADYHTAASKILQVNLKAMTIQIAAPAGQNFDYMDSVQIYLGAPGQPEALVAWQYGISKGISTLVLATDANVNLKDYFVQETITFRMKTHINAVPASGEQLNIGAIFHLLANPLE
jgi:hypothetical protein